MINRNHIINDTGSLEALKMTILDGGSCYMGYSNFSASLRSSLSILSITITALLLVACIESTKDTETTPVYSISGTVISEDESLVENARVTIDGIEAVSLTDSSGQFVVQSHEDFLSSAFLSASKDGFESYSAEVTLTGVDNSYQITDAITLTESIPWDYLEIDVTASGTQQTIQSESFTNSINRVSSVIPTSGTLSDARDGECDCTVTLSGKAFKKGGKKTKAYILLAVDASGSSAEKSIGDQTVFEIEIEALTALVNSLTEHENLNVGIVRFASDASLELDFTTDLSAVNRVLSAMTPEEPKTSGAATNYEAALSMVIDSLIDIKLKKSDIKTVVFLSDGIPTAPFESGITQEKEDRIASIDAAKLLKEKQIVVNTFPVNVTSKLTTLPAISAITGGIYHDIDGASIADQIDQYSLVGLKGIEVVNETTNSDVISFNLSPDGWFSGEVCLSSAEDNHIKVTPLVCEDCEKTAYQKIKASCEGEECSACAGQITMLELTYTGDLENAKIRVEQSQKNKDAKILFDSTVSAQESFEFYGAEKDKTMGPSISVYINDDLSGEFVTSCGEPKTLPGLVNGSFEVVRGYSRNGGLLCP